MKFALFALVASATMLEDFEEDLIEDVRVHYPAKTV